MELPPQITFHRLERSDAIATHVREQKLEKYFDRIHVPRRAAAASDRRGCVRVLRGTGKSDGNMSSKKLTVDAQLEKLQRETFGYFWHETNPANGLVIDKTAADWPSSIAATGLALACYPVSVERGFMSRAAAVERTLATLRFFWNSPQGPADSIRDRLF